MKKPVASTAKSACNTRQKLVDAAHDLIWANSYAQVSVDGICKKAGVQKGSFYHFFPTKADLAAAALENHWAQTQPEIEAIFTSNLTAKQQLQSICKKIRTKQEDSLAATGKVCGCPYATVGAELGGSGTALHVLADELGERFLGYFEKILRQAAKEGVIPSRGVKTRAAEMHVYVLGAMLQARLTNSLDTVGKSMEHALHRISGIPS